MEKTGTMQEPAFSGKKIAPGKQVLLVGLKAKYEIGYNFERDHYNTVKMLCKLHFYANFPFDCAINLPPAI